MKWCGATVLSVAGLMASGVDSRLPDAARKMDRPAVRALLEQQHADVNARELDGTSALHWAANRGQLETVQLLLRWRAPLETVNVHGATALGMVIWSAIHEPRPQHLAIVEELLGAGAKREAVQRPTGHPELDAVLGRELAP